MGSIGDLFRINITLFLRILAFGFGIHSIQSSHVFCKLISYITICSMVLSNGSIVLASIDRYVLTSRSVNMRSLANISIAKRLAFIIICLSFVFPIHLLFDYNAAKSIRVCVLKFSSKVYKAFLSVSYLILFGILPPTLLITFGILTLKNIRSLRSSRSNFLRRIDYNLTIMVLSQIILTILAPLAYSIYAVYNNYIGDTTEQNMWVNHLVALISYIECTCGFYFYIGISKRFRQHFFKIITRQHPGRFQTSSE
ncbi:unnamed protein product [Didymodactylos carnosus]|uniref:G-protein coupled receptors family 1 profile domain-containing protein n=1 Tax=Didymodactylos carnosus TaxID=1234261 RepID=A0A813UVV2_9BILA|nr:unnamed protein product [Didymodactylos carnosus]CAF1570555.1 unnamed protein product [Didymodactylos carnosus]CAF3621754.1 unnamed protein product [Didymodactylos carnosus]CAF4364930.1 unnamed protein product [Didymodactylos carnosus]